MTDSTQGPEGPEQESGPQGPVIRDKRRLDPETGEVRQPAGETASEAPVAEEAEPERPEAEEAAPDVPEAAPQGDQAAALLEDLRRLQAEYVNYKRRVDRDRARERELAVGGVVEAMLPVLDDIHSAREHGDLVEGPFAAIADKLEATLGRFGVERFGAAGETFDPTQHEALMHLPEAELPEGATETTVVQVVQPGFRVGDRLVRAARVAVADP